MTNFFFLAIGDYLFAGEGGLEIIQLCINGVSAAAVY